MSDITPSNRAVAPSEALRVPLADIDVAPENLRATEPADDAIPELADTIAAAGLLYPLLVRPGRQGEAPWMALDGRRRLLALRVLAQDGRTAPDRPVKVEVARAKAAQAAAIVISNTQRAPVHVADVIVAIGQLKSLKLTPAKIALALGYTELEVRRLQRLAGLPQAALAALKAGRITLRTAKLLARVTDQEALERFTEQAAAGYLYEHSLAHHLEGRPRLDDPLFDLIGVERYRAAGGRIDPDLFGDFGDVVLDPDKLQGLWAKRVQPFVEAAQARGLVVYLQGGELYRAPEEFEVAGPNGASMLSEDGRLAFELACARTGDLARALSQGERHREERDGDLLAFLVARLEQEQALHGAERIGAVGFFPEVGTGFDVQVYLKPVELPDLVAEVEGDDDHRHDGRHSDLCSGSLHRPEIVVPRQEFDTGGRGHSLHETYTDMATRGLIRSLADDPNAALTVAVARLFVILALHGGGATEQSASTLQGRRYSRGSLPPHPALDGAVRARLETKRRAYLDSGQRPIPWVDALAHGEKMELLAELVAISLDLKEAGAPWIRHAARAEAAEIAELTGHDIAAYWTPDADFLGHHTKTQLLGALAAMGADVAPTKGLKKDELVGYVVSVAAEKGWAPPALNLRAEPAVIAGAEGTDAVPDPLAGGLADPLDGADAVTSQIDDGRLAQAA